MAETLTQRTADALKPPTGITKTGKPVNQTFLWATDPKGFGIRCTRNGVKTWVAQGRVNGVDRRIKIGPFDRLKCEAARTRARKKLLDMLDGVDPVAQEQRQVAQATTLREVAEHYVQHRQTRHGPLRPATVADIWKHVDKSLGPWTHKPIGAVTPDMVIARFKELSKKGPTSANGAFTVFQALHDWARKLNAELPPNPVSVLKGMWNPSNPRTEYVPFDKLPAVYQALHLRGQVRDRTGTRVGGDLGLFLLLTGARWADATRLTWDCVHLDDDAPWWHILKERAKNHTERMLPLSTQAADMLRARHADRPRGSELVFPSHSNPKRAPWNVPAVWEMVTRICGVDVSPHSMRRTWVNLAVKLGHELWRAEMLTSHVPSGVTLRHYFDNVDLRDMRGIVQNVSDNIEGAGK